MISVFMCFRISSSLAAEAAFASYSLRKAVGSTRTELAAPIFAAKWILGLVRNAGMLFFVSPPRANQFMGVRCTSSTAVVVAAMSSCRYAVMA